LTRRRRPGHRSIRYRTALACIRWRIGRSITQTAERGILLDTTAEVDSIKDEQ